MTQDNNNPTPAVAAIAASTPAAAPAAPSQAPQPYRGGGGRGGDMRGGRGGRGGGRDSRGRGGKGGDRKQDEFESKIVDLSRVTRVMAGGKRMRFRATVVVGDKKGRVGMAVTKGADVTLAVNKSTTKAKKNLIKVPLVHGTIPHAIEVKFRGALVLLKPAPKGTGVKAGGPVRMVLDLAGVKDVVSKMKGSKNKVANVHAVLKAFSMLRTKEELANMRQVR